MIRLLLLLWVFAIEAAPPELAPYLIPEDHPIKERLDAFFGRKRVSFHENSLKEAGFSNYTPREFTRLIVAKHPEFPGYIFKIYLDVQRYYHSRPEWYFWVMRVRGANLIRKEVEEKGWQHLFKVPQKWIYVLPSSPKAKKGYLAKETILVEEDMELLDRSENKAAWKSERVNRNFLVSLYHILHKFELLDCAKIDNIPFAQDGRVAFVDTQTFYAGYVEWDSLNRHLNRESRAFWVWLTRQH